MLGHQRKTYPKPRLRATSIWKLRAEPEKMDATSATQRRKVALITGVTGQDGSYLTELLLSKGYVVRPDLHDTGVEQRSTSDQEDWALPAPFTEERA